MEEISSEIEPQISLCLRKRARNYQQMNRISTK